MGSGIREIQRHLIAAGFTRQLRYSHQRMMWRLYEAEQNDLRWCLRCGRDLDPGMPLDAMYCCASCRVRACQMRRARGYVSGLSKPPKILEGYDLDWRTLAHHRADMFYRCHGRFIEDAGEVCPRWREAPRPE